MASVEQRGQSEGKEEEAQLPWLPDSPTLAPAMEMQRSTLALEGSNHKVRDDF